MAIRQELNEDGSKYLDVFDDWCVIASRRNNIVSNIVSLSKDEAQSLQEALERWLK